MAAFDSAKALQLVVGIVGVYSIYSITGLLQESVYPVPYSASKASIATMSPDNCKA